MACGKGFCRERLGSEILERLTVTEWHGSTEPLRATPRSNPKSEEAKRRVFGVFGGTYDSGVFLAVPLPLFSTERGRKPSGDPSEDPHPHRHLKSGTPCRVS